MFNVKEYIASLGNPAEITALVLNSKNITELEEDTFQHLTQPKWLFLSRNQLSSLPPNLFQHNPKLESLNLGGNQLSSLPPNLFQHNPKLKWLNLDNNQLSSLPPNLFQHNPQLKRLYLSENQLSSLPPVPQTCKIRGREEIEKRGNQKKEHWNKWRWVGADVECFPPCPSNYSHLSAFTKTFLGVEGGVEYVRGLEEFEELKYLEEAYSN